MPVELLKTIEGSHGILVVVWNANLHAFSSTRGCSSTTSLTGILPRVAFEYGQTSWASSTSFSAVASSEEHTSELQSPDHLVCRLLLEKKNAIGTLASIGY